MAYLEKNFRQELLDVFRSTKHLAIPLETGSTYRGVPDVMIFMGSQPAMFVELKCTGSKVIDDIDKMRSMLRPEQDRFAERMTKRKQKCLLITASSPQKGTRVFNIVVPKMKKNGIIYGLVTVSGTKKEALNKLVDKLEIINYTIE